jgi:hypothetical protein
MQVKEVHEAVRDGIIRGLAIVGLAGIALIHLLDAPGQFEGTPYLGWMYVALIVGCILVGGALVRSSDPRAWTAAGGLALSVIVGYTLSRTTGLPGSTDDIGNWGEQLGMASLFVEGAVVGVSAFALRERFPQARFRAAVAEVAR